MRRAIARLGDARSRVSTEHIDFECIFNKIKILIAILGIFIFHVYRGAGLAVQQAAPPAWPPAARRHLFSLAPPFSSGIGTRGEAHAEAEVVAADAGAVVVPARRPAAPGVVPAATAKHAVRACGWSCGIRYG